MMEPIFNIRYDAESFEWYTVSGDGCLVNKTNGPTSTTFVYLLGENYGDDHFSYTVMHPIDNKGEIAVIANGSQWQMLGKANIPADKWGAWVQNLVHADVLLGLSDEDHRQKRILMDQDESDYDGVIKDDEIEIKSDWKPKAVAVMGFKDKESMQKFVDSVDIDKVEGSDGGRLYEDATIFLKLIEANAIHD